MMTIADLLQELDQEAEATRRVLERVPEARLDWRPHPKSMTLGELAMHVALLPGSLTEVSTLPRFDVNTEIPRPSAAGVGQLTSALAHSLAKARTILGAMDDAALATPWRMVDGEHEVMVLPRGAFLRSVMLNHWYHHRGQLTVYLRLTGAPVPAVYGASADENPLRARPDEARVP
jgi:uncharacterized damage-inducible protein DinB